MAESSKQYLIHPKEPIASHPELKDANAVNLLGYDLWMKFIKNVHLIPLVLDVDRFNEALAKAITKYPHTAGRLRTSDSQWKIHLTDSPIPVEVAAVQDMTLNPNGWVILDNIDPFLNPEPKGVSLINGEASLLRMKLTMSDKDRCTAIGVSWNHTLGDATALLRFMHLLSQEYQGLNASYPPPTFKKHVFPVPSDQSIEIHSASMAHLTEACPVSELSERYKRFSHSTSAVRVDWRFTELALANLRTKVQSMIGDTEYKLSIQDCLTGYIVSIINRCAAVPVRRVTNAASYRSISAPFVDPHIAGNAIHIIPSEAIDPSNISDIHIIAKTIRQSLRKHHDPILLENRMSVASHLMLEIANTGKSLFFQPREDTISVNSYVALDWRSIHFGSPSSSFFTVGVSRYYLRVFRSNHTGNIDICLGVPKDMQQDVVDLLCNASM